VPARQHRVTRGDDYRRIVRSGNRAGGRLCVAYAAPHEAAGDGSPARFGFIVAKSVGNAVTRNLVRRRLKTIADRSLAGGFAGADVVFRALPASATAEFSELEREAERSLRRVGRSAAQRRAGA